MAWEVRLDRLLAAAVPPACSPALAEWALAEATVGRRNSLVAQSEISAPEPVELAQP